MKLTKNVLTVALMLVTLTFTFGAVSAQDEVTAALTAGRSNLTVGDVVPLTFEVTHPAGWRVIAPELPEQWGDYEVRAQLLPTIRDNGDGTETTSQQIDVALFAPGTFQTPLMEFRLVNDSGQMTTRQVTPLSLTINSVLTPDDMELRDIKPQAELPVPFVSPLVYIGAVALVAVSVAALALAIRRQQANRPVIDTRSIYQVAYDDLNAIDGRRFVEHGDYRSYAEEVSNVMRRLLERMYGISLKDHTLLEVRRMLRDVDLPPDYLRFALSLLVDCDYVKFGHEMPDANDIAARTTRARQFILLVEPMDAARQVRMEGAA